MRHSKHKRQRPAPKHGKYLYRYWVTTDDVGHVTDVVGKDKLYIYFWDAKHLWVRPKNVDSLMLSVSRRFITPNLGDKACFIHGKCVEYENHEDKLALYTLDNYNMQDIREYICQTNTQFVIQRYERQIQNIQHQMDRENTHHTLVMSDYIREKNELEEKVKLLQSHLLAQNTPRREVHDKHTE